MKMDFNKNRMLNICRDISTLKTASILDIVESLERLRGIIGQAETALAIQANEEKAAKKKARKKRVR